MSDGGATGGSIAALIAALDDLSAKINEACAEDSRSVDALLKMAFKGTPYEVSQRGALNDRELVGAAMAVQNAQPPKVVKGGPAADKGKRSKSLPQPVFEYVVLAQLNRQQTGPIQKADLIASLPGQLDFGNPAAVTTRLNKMRNGDINPYITWDRFKQQTAIQMTEDGVKRFAELTGSSPRSLSVPMRQELSSMGAWFGGPL